MGQNPYVLFPVEITESTPLLLTIGTDLSTVGVREVRLLHVVNTVEALSVPRLIEARRSILHEYRDLLRSHGIEKVSGEVVVGTAWAEIVQRAADRACSMVVMGSHGKSLIERVFLGSQTENVLHRGDRSLLIVRLCFQETQSRTSWSLSPEQLFSRILYATDFSEGARRCVPFLEQVAAARPEMLSIAHVQDIRRLSYLTNNHLAALEQKAEQELATLLNHFHDLGYRDVRTSFTRGNAISEILRMISEDHPSLIVMGAKGSYGIVERALGGVSDAVVHRAPVHVAIIR